jgi:hypothetical protein
VLAKAAATNHHNHSQRHYGSGGHSRSHQQLRRRHYEETNGISTREAEETGNSFRVKGELRGNEWEGGKLTEQDEVGDAEVDRESERERGMERGGTFTQEYRRPTTLVKLTHTARGRAALDKSGVDVVLSLQEFKYTVLAMGALFPGFIALFLNLNRARRLGSNISQKFEPGKIMEMPWYKLCRFCIVS